jgi:hypothetical protein
MLMKYIVISLIILRFIFPIAAQDIKQTEKIQPERIENIKILNEEIGDNFILYQEDILKPNNQAAGQIHQCLKRDFSIDKMKLVTVETMNFAGQIGSSCMQTWYRNGKKEKIEVDIILCPNDNEINKVIEIFTKKIYSIQFNQTEIPLVGDISWVADNFEDESDSYSIMYLKANVFVRIYVNMNNENKVNVKPFVNKLANKIETKILSNL